jgi:hypothetical protein
VKNWIYLYLFILSGIPWGTLKGQSSPAPILERIISVSLHHRPLTQVLDSIGQRGHFEFSYNSNIIPGDSLVSLNLRQVTVKQALETLLGTRYTYNERGNYLIIMHPNEERPPPESNYQLSGYVMDGQTGKRLANASVYEKDQLESTLTDDQGYFRLRLKTKYPRQVLTISKEWYMDTVITIQAGYDQTFNFILAPATAKELSPVFINPSNVERTKWGRLLLSSKQCIQSLNLSHFFMDKPYQLSLTPVLGTHGSMSGQVTNTISINLLGGYSAGAKGLELGGLFNIDKKDVHFVQAAGIFNLVGGNVKGVQLAGAFNSVMDTMVGLQASGIVSIVKADMKGFQISGLVNSVGGKVSGVQAAGIADIARDTLRGIQVSTFFNKSAVVKGVQIGLLNISDTSTGYSVGLVNIVKRGGISALSLSIEDISGLTLTYKSGTAKLYDIILTGYDPWFSQHLFSIGYGIGKSFALGKYWGFSTELTSRKLFDDHWHSMGAMFRLEPLLALHLGGSVSLFAGPTFSIHVYDANMPTDVSKPPLPGSGYPSTLWGGRSAAWIGAAFGISFH